MNTVTMSWNMIRVEPREDAASVVARERRFEAEAQNAADDERDEERRRLDFERAGGEHERREGKRRRDQIEHRERDCAFLAARVRAHFARGGLAAPSGRALSRRS